MQRRIPSDALRFSLLATPLAIVLAAGCGSNGTPQDTQTTAPMASEPGPGGARYAVIDGAVVPVPQITMGNAATIAAILDEGKNRNQVMNHLNYLCGDIGPRLTASTALERANFWCAERFEAWGLSNVENRVWAEATLRFDRGPSYGRVMEASDSGEFTEERELEFTTLSWAPGTNGPTRGRVVRMPPTLDELEAGRGSFDDAWVLISPYQGGREGVRGIGRAMAARHVMHADLRQAMGRGEMATIDLPESFPNDGVSGVWTGTARGPAIPNGETVYSMTLRLNDDGTVTGTAGLPNMGFTADLINGAYENGVVEFLWRTPVGDREMFFPLDDGFTLIETLDPAGEDLYTFEAVLQQPEPADPEELSRFIAQEILAEGPAGFVSSSRDERVWTTSVKRGEELLNLTREDVGQDVEINVRDSDYRWINSDLADGQDVFLEFDLSHSFEDGPIPLYNTIAEIPGTEKPDEVVIVCAHIDSWNGPGSQGVLDNGTGTAVTLEAARILANVGARPKRTIRFMLWTGEEQGLLGARAYVDSLTEEERSKIVACLNDDGGTNYQGGYPAASVMVPYLAAASAPTNGQFFSEVDRERLLKDDNPDNDARAGWLEFNVRDTGSRINTHRGSDHAVFNQAGIPGFFSDEVGRSNYRFGWHTQNDKLDLA
ncbi:MAG: M20/M25/M40 family metallo-hydrolase, partial [Planctomycetota bacterium]